MTLKRLSCNTFLIAISSPSFCEPTSLAWKTTPKEPFPMTLQLVYEISLVSADFPSDAITLTTLCGSSIAENGKRARDMDGTSWIEDEEIE